MWVEGKVEALSLQQPYTPKKIKVQLWNPNQCKKTAERMYLKKFLVVSKILKRLLRTRCPLVLSALNGHKWGILQELFWEFRTLVDNLWPCWAIGVISPGLHSQLVKYGGLSRSSGGSCAVCHTHTRIRSKCKFPLIKRGNTKWAGSKTLVQELCNLPETQVRGSWCSWDQCYLKEEVTEYAIQIISCHFSVLRMGSHGPLGACTKGLCLQDWRLLPGQCYWWGSTGFNDVLSATASHSCSCLIYCFNCHGFILQSVVQLDV